MPTYEYKCKKCNKTFEKFQSISDKHVKKCIHCNGEVNRVFHPVGVIYKGTGFYTTDYKKKERKTKKASKPKENKKEKPAACTNKDNCPSAKSCN